jgi:peroxiredoxin
MKRVLRSAFVLCAAASLGSGAAAAPKPIRPAPALTFVTADGLTVSLEALKGKVVVVEFGLTHCPACQSSAQMLSKFQTEYGPQGFQVVAVMMDPEAPLKLREFSNLYAKTFPVGVYDYTLARKWLQTPEVMRLLVPVIVVIDRAGNIREQHAPDEKPWADKKEEMLRASLKMLLAEKAPRPPAAKAATKKK